MEKKSFEPTTQAQEAPELMEYSVKGSDTLASIALKFNTTTSKLARMNRLSSRLLFPGQTLFVPVKIDLLEKEAAKQKEQDELELVTRPPSTRSFPGRQASFSPDFQMEELLRKDDNGKDEISEKFLRLNGRYITDGQGVVPGVLLVTPRTVMFNPSVSDHLVIDRGREAYTVKTPMKAVKDIAYYQDIAALVLGDTSCEFIPDSSHLTQSNWQANSTMNTSNYFSQDTVDMLSETASSSRQDGDASQPLNQGESDQSQDEQKSCVTMEEHDSSQNATAPQDMSQDETITEHCSCSKMSMDDSNGLVDSNLDETMNEQSSTTAVLRGTFTNHDRDASQVSNAARGTIENAATSRDIININDTKCTSTPRKIKESTVTCTRAEMKDDGLIYTKIQPRINVKSLTGNAIQLEAEKRVVQQPVSFASAKPFSEGESFSQIDASRDSGISEGASFQSTSSSIGSAFSREASEKNRPMSPRSSSLSSEARQWLGKRGIRFSGDSEDEGNCSESFDMSKEELSKPKPPALTADQLAYVCLRVHKSYWCRSATLQTHIMGVPQNRDQQRMEHWYAVPKERIGQLHAFFTLWKRAKDDSPNQFGVNKSSGLSIIDDTFAKPSAEELLLERFEEARLFKEPYKEGYNRTFPATGSRKSTISSLNEDDAPELTDDSAILEKVQLAALARELPSRTVGHKWNLAYSTSVHGISLKTLYRNTQNIETPVLLVILDQDGKTFGAFMSDPPKISEGFYGTGESLLFTFVDKKAVKAFRWTGTNSFFIKGDALCLSIGGGDGMFGLWLDEDLNHGRSHACKTFDNETLSSKEDFVCRGLEAWSFG